MRKKLLSLGWKSKVSLKRATFNISINKAVAVGQGLVKGQVVYCYLEEDENRPVIVMYLDGKPKHNK